MSAQPDGDPIAALQQVLAGGGGQDPGGQPQEAPQGDPSQQGPPVQPEDLGETLDEVLGAVRMAASASRSSQDPREVRELGQGALAFAQAFVIMHPALLAPQGVAPEVMAASIAQQNVPPAPGGTTGRPPQPTARRDGTVKG